MNKNEMQEYIKKLQRHVLTLEAKVLTIREIAEEKVEATHQEVSWYPPSSEMARKLRNQVTGMRRVRDAIIDELDAEDSFYAAVQVNEARLRKSLDDLKEQESYVLMKGLRGDMREYAESDYRVIRRALGVRDALNQIGCDLGLEMDTVSKVEITEAPTIDDTMPKAVR